MVMPRRMHEALPRKPRQKMQGVRRGSGRTLSGKGSCRGARVVQGRSVQKVFFHPFKLLLADFSPGVALLEDIQGGFLALAVTPSPEEQQEHDNYEEYQEERHHERKHPSTATPPVMSRHYGVSP